MRTKVVGNSVTVTIGNDAEMLVMEQALREQFASGGTKRIKCGHCGTWFTAAQDAIDHTRMRRASKDRPS